MDPKILQQIQQIQQAQQGQGQAQGQPQQDPSQGGDQGGSQFDFSQNPFQDILQGQAPQSQDASRAAMMMQSASGQGQDAETPQDQSQPGDTTEDATQPGVNPGTTKPLLQAVNALHSFISTSTDRDEIAIVRSMIALLSKLVQNDQSKQMQNDGAAQDVTQG